MFEGGKTIRFTSSCDFVNKKGPIVICLTSFANDVTTNYQKANTITISILTNRMDTITIYPVDGSYLETKFNNIIKNYNLDISLHFDLNR